MASFNRSVWPAQRTTVEGIGSLELTPYDLVLYDAIVNLDHELIIMMLNRGASPDNLVPIAVDRGAASIIEILIELGANVDKLSRFVSQTKPELMPSNSHALLGIGLRKAITAKNIVTVHLILSQMDREEDLPNKDLALGMAVRSADSRLALEALKAGNLNPNQGLHYAAQFNNVDMARLMIMQGANVDQVAEIEESRGLVNMTNFLKSLK